MLCFNKIFFLKPQEQFIFCKVLEIYFTSVWICLTLLNCTLKTVKIMFFLNKQIEFCIHWYLGVGEKAYFLVWGLHQNLCLLRPFPTSSLILLAISLLLIPCFICYLSLRASEPDSCIHGSSGLHLSLSFFKIWSSSKYARESPGSWIRTASN